ncbi:MAG: AraC family ligand binding domain-containing protein [Oscillospiraceae bacterium]|nr:AraC family ligand binding domain-containing protein [Oscillospiraceae bacterium]
MITFTWNGYKFSIVQFDMGIFEKDMTGHSHSKNSYELHYIIGGKGTLATSNTVYSLSKGNFFVTGPNIYHQQSTDKEDPLQEIFVYLQTGGEKTNDSLVSAFLSTHFYFCKNKELQKYFEMMLCENQEKKLGYDAAVGAIMQLLLTHITRIYLPQFNNISENNGNLNDRRFFIIESAFIDNPTNITLAALSESIGLCERQTQRLLKKYYGKSFTQKKEEAAKKDDI